MKPLKILIADESGISRSSCASRLLDAAAKLGRSLDIVARVADGEALLAEFEKANALTKIDFVFTEVRLPKIDGLSALVRLRSRQSLQRVVMVSAEDVDTMESRNRALGVEASANARLDPDQKLDLLRKIAVRVTQGRPEAGKLQSMLEGCEKLAADPIAVARHFGAAGYLHKPYDLERMVALLRLLEEASDFALVA